MFFSSKLPLEKNNENVEEDWINSLDAMTSWMQRKPGDNTWASDVVYESRKYNYELRWDSIYLYIEEVPV